MYPLGKHTYTCQVVRIGKRSSKWRWLKDNRTKESPRTRVRNSGKTNSPPSQTNLHSAGSGGRRQMYKRRKPRRIEAPLLGWPTLEGVFSFTFYMKLSCNTNSSVASKFCRSKTEPRKLQTPPTYLTLLQNVRKS